MGSKNHKKKAKSLGLFKKKSKPLKIETECKLCGEFFIGKDHLALSRHLYEKHTRSVDNECDTCGNKYSDKKGLIRHLLFIHLEYRPYKCRVCDRKFARRDLFKIHLSKVHPECDNEKEIKAGSEPWNPDSQDSPNESKEHTGSSKHPASSQSSGEKGSVEESKGEDKGGGISEEYFVPKCIICLIPLNPPNRMSLSRHLNAEHTAAKACEKCGNQYADRKGLLRHYMHVHFSFRPYSCTQCNRSFARKDHFRNHTLQHHASKSERAELFECDKCEKVFVKQDSLMKHILVCVANEGKVNVERILDKREVNGRVEYLIKWEGYNESESTWESEAAITGRPDDEEVSEEESSEDNNEGEETDTDDYLDHLYPTPNLCHMDIGVL